MLWESFISASTKLTSRCVITELGAVGCRARAHVAADHVSVLDMGAAEQALVSQSENCPADFPHNCSFQLGAYRSTIELCLSSRVFLVWRCLSSAVWGQ